MNEKKDDQQLMEMMDGARGEFSQLSQDMENQRRIASSPDLPMELRLEAFEDITDSEVGDSTMWRARNIEREMNLRQIYLKFEGGNPTGTQKDRIAFAQVRDAMRRGFDTIMLATCGNYGVAMALAASLAGVRCIIYIPETYHTQRVAEMLALKAEIVRVPGDYEAAVEKCRQDAESKENYDANPGGANTSIQLLAYAGIANEIYDELRDAPKAVAVPVSNGTTLAGIYKGFLSLYRRGKTSRIPQIVAGSSFRKNPIISAFLKNQPNCVDLNPKSILETRINEPLINWHSIDGHLALEAIRQTQGWAVNATDRNMQSLSRLIREKEGLNVIPASTAGLAAMMERHRQQPFTNDRYVVLLTGRKS